MNETPAGPAQDWIWLEWVADGVIVVNGFGAIIVANHRACRLFGYEPWELIGAPVDVLVAPAAREAHRRQRDDYRNAPRVREMGVGLDTQGVHKDGSLLALDIHLQPILGGELMIASVRDRRSVVAIESRLQLLTDRERDARALLDIVIQRLYGISLTLEAIPEASEQVIDRLDRSGGLIDETIELIRSTSLEPAGRDDQLAAAQERILLSGNDGPIELG